MTKIKRIEKESHRIHGTGIFTYIYHKTQANIPYMDPMEMNKYEEMKSTKKTHTHLIYYLQAGLD